MTTSSKLLQAAPLEVVHLSVDIPPMVSPVIPLEGEDGSVINADPEITVQSPVPTIGVFPANVVVVVLQRFWSVPAAAEVGGKSTVIIMSSVELGQFPFMIVHRKVAELPMDKLVIPDVGDEGIVTVPEPLINDQEPVPTDGVLPDNEAEVTLQRF